MAGITRRCHFTSNIEWGKWSRIVPDVPLNFEAPNGEKPEEPMALAFVDPDGEAHVYLFTEEGRKILIGKLTGGLIVPSGGGH